ncbi:hypothetical protein D3C74_55110 [compost metagenome]
MKETELYAPVKEWLEAQGYTAYPEVECRVNRADVVGIKGNESVIVEMKTSLSLELIAQGVEWVYKNSANKVYLAIPRLQKDISYYVSSLLSREGLGLIMVDPYEKSEWIGKCRVRLNPRDLDVTLALDRDNISKAVTPMHLELGIEGGHSGGGYLTTYKATMIRVQQFLWESKKGEWTLMKEILSNCTTHYSGDNPGAALGRAMEQFESTWCETKIINRRKHFRAKEGMK